MTGVNCSVVNKLIFFLTSFDYRIVKTNKLGGLQVEYIKKKRSLEKKGEGEKNEILFYKRARKKDKLLIIKLKKEAKQTGK